MIKKSIFAFIFGLVILSFCFSQEQENAQREWKGTVRFNPADLFINLHNALPGIYVTWTHFILPNFGIPAEIDINFGWGVLPGVEISILSGIEYLLAGKNKKGFFLDAKIGLSLFFNEDVKAAFIAKANIGYQLVTKKGFVFTPAIGGVYNGRSGLGLNLMLDLGFAY
ncbi:MAG: hypothetical protein FWB86_11455 [Treponema sp.]|nr:hypothetical protein [Treponema sp.]MCL2252530.1 hypothetical protein [Treponema sp.]